MSGLEDKHIASHYAPQDLEEAVLSALRDLEGCTTRLTPGDTAPIDEFHVRGREATLELAGRLDLSPGHQVLDVGSGLGGPSRHLADTCGCHVTGLDLTEKYCRVARMIAGRLGLDDRLTYIHGNALEMPFPDAAFDVVWTQHTSMNISDKGRFYAEIRRVLKPGGLFAMYDVLAGAEGTPYFPLPWARDPAMSFLLSPEALRRVMVEKGFQILSWCDTSELGRKWFREAAAGRPRQQSGRQPLSLQTVFGPDIRVMSKNVIRNLDENRIALIEVIAR